MKKWIPMVAALTIAMTSIAGAQTYGTTGNTATGPGHLSYDSSGNLKVTSSGSTVITVPSASSVTSAAVTCGTSSTALGVTGTSYLSIMIPPTGSTVCFGWGVNSATTSPPSECFAGGTSISWGGGTGSCIVATGSQAISVETK